MVLSDRVVQAISDSIQVHIGCSIICLQTIHLQLLFNEKQIQLIDSGTQTGSCI